MIIDEYFKYFETGGAVVDKLTIAIPNWYEVEIDRLKERIKVLEAALKNVHKHYQDQCNHLLKPASLGGEKDALPRS